MHKNFSFSIAANPNPRNGTCNLGYTQMAYGWCNFVRNDGANAIEAEAQCVNEGGHLTIFENAIVSSKISEKNHATSFLPTVLSKSIRTPVMLL